MKRIEGEKSPQKENILANDIVDVLYPYPYEKLPEVKVLEKLNKTVSQRYSYFYGLNFEEILKDYAGKIVKHFPKSDHQENNDFLKKASGSWIEVFNTPDLKDEEGHKAVGFYIRDENNLKGSFTILVPWRGTFMIPTIWEISKYISPNEKEGLTKFLNKAFFRHLIMHETLHAFIDKGEERGYTPTLVAKLYEEGIDFYAAEIFKNEGSDIEWIMIKPFFKNWQVFLKVMGEEVGREFIFQKGVSTGMTSVLESRWGNFFPKMKSLFDDALFKGKWGKIEAFINKISCRG